MRVLIILILLTGCVALKFDGFDPYYINEVKWMVTNEKK